LRDWLAEQGEGASGVRIGELSAPGANGFSNLTALARDSSSEWQSRSRDLFAFRSDNDLAQLAALRAGF
jgi:hypothetical protein